MKEMEEAKLRQLCREMLLAMGENPDRAGLKETPDRWAKMILEVTTGHKFNPKTFDAEGMDEMVVQKEIVFYSLCEHHMVPFFGTATIGYIPDKTIIGLSKLSRMVEKYSRSLQVQERLTSQVAHALQDILKPKAIGVVMRARHLCQEMRGIRKVGAETITSYLMGAFREDPCARKEFLDLAR